MAKIEKNTAFWNKIVFKIEDKHFLRFWIQANRFQWQNPYFKLFLQEKGISKI